MGDFLLRFTMVDVGPCHVEYHVESYPGIAFWVTLAVRWNGGERYERRAVTFSKPNSPCCQAPLVRSDIEDPRTAICSDCGWRRDKLPARSFKLGGPALKRAMADAVNAVVADERLDPLHGAILTNDLLAFVNTVLDENCGFFTPARQCVEVRSSAEDGLQLTGRSGAVDDRPKGWRMATMYEHSLARSEASPGTR